VGCPGLGLQSSRDFTSQSASSHIVEYVLSLMRQDKLMHHEALAKKTLLCSTVYKRNEVIGLVVAARSISTTSLVHSPAYLIALFLSERSIVDAPVHSAPIPFVLCCNPLLVWTTSAFMVMTSRSLLAPAQSWSNFTSCYLFYPGFLIDGELRIKYYRVRTTTSSTSPNTRYVPLLLPPPAASSSNYPPPICLVLLA
jgi:hypothetical protein